MPSRGFKRINVCFDTGAKVAYHFVASRQCGGRRIEQTEVIFNSVTPDQIREYIASGEPMDKAGAYGIQGLASKFIYRVKGCYFNVVGLPVSRIHAFLRSRSEHGFE